MMGLRPLFEVTSGIKMVCTVGIQYNPLRIPGFHIFNIRTIGRIV
jgi:hypothetical protein